MSSTARSTTAPPCRAPTSTSRPRSPRCRPICEASAPAGLEAIRELSEQFDGVAPRRHPGAGRRAGRRAGRASTRRSGPGSRSRSAGCAPPARPSSSTTSSPTSVPGARVTHRKVPVGRVGLYVPGGLAPLVSSVLMNVVPAQVAGVALDRAGQPAAEGATAGCRTPRSWPPARCSASTRSTPSAAPRRSRCSPTAPARAPRSTWSPAPATSTRSPPSGCSRAWSASTPRPARPRSRSSPTTPPTRRTSPPTWSARPSTTRWPPRVLVTASRALADEVEAELDKQVSATKHVERIRTALAGRAVRRSCWSTTSSRASRSSTPTPPSTSRSRPRTPPPCAARVRNAGAIFVGAARAGVPRRLLRRLQPRAAHRRLRLPLLGLSVRAFLKSVHVVDYSREALAEVADHVVDARRGRGPARPRRRRPRPLRPAR